MKTTHTIAAQTGHALELKKGKSLRIVDVEGGQVADLVGVCLNNHGEYTSTKVTMDMNGSIHLLPDQIIYSNEYNAVLTLTESSVPTHDLLFPACSPAMYERQYGVKEHPSCATNLTQVLRPYNIERIPDPVNIFMNTAVDAAGMVRVETPLSQSGDAVELRAEVDLILAIAACSVDESLCNGQHCTDLRIELL